MLIVEEYEVDAGDLYSAGITEKDNTFLLLGVIPKHWPMNERRIERLKANIERINTAQFSPIEIAIALALYGYNVSAYDRAKKIYEHFDGFCPDMDDLIRYMEHYGCAATALPFPSAEVYVQHALDKYGEEAKERVRVEKEVQENLDRLTY